MKWIKTYGADLDDLRFAHMADDPEAEQVYSRLYRLAGLLDADGLFLMNGRKLTDEEIAHRIRLPLPRVSKAIKRLQKYELLHVNGKGPQIIDFPNQQVDLNKVREQTKERVTRYRALHKDTNALQGDVTTPDQRPDSDPDSDQDSDKDQPTTLPSSRKKRAGGMAGSKSESPAAVIKPNKAQRARKDKIIKILASFGIRKPKLETLSTILATRSYKSDDQMIAKVLGGIASALSDERAKNKEAVAAYRLENDQVSSRFEDDPNEWKIIPKNVIEAAGITDLSRYIINKRYQGLGLR